MNLAEAGAQADELAQRGAERELADLRRQWEDELEAAARGADYRERAAAYRGIGQFRFRQKLELLRRAMNEFANTLPSHDEALRKYCSN